MEEYMSQPKAIILRTAGTNCDVESAFAAEKAGFKAERVHVNRVASGEVKLDEYSFMFIPGGFSYGDDIAAGKIMALELNKRLGTLLCSSTQKGSLYWAYETVSRCLLKRDSYLSAPQALPKCGRH